MRGIPTHLSEKLKKAEKLELKKDYKLALKEYKSILEEEKKLPQVWFQAGSLYSRVSKSRKALICFEQAIRYGYPKNLYYNLGIEYFKLADYEQAFDCIQKCIQDSPKFLPAFLMSAVIANRMSNTAEAMISIENLFKIDPDHRAAHSAMVVLCLKKKDHKKAFYHIERLESLGEGIHILDRLKTKVLIEKGDLEGSIDLLRNISQEDPKIEKLNSTIKKEISLYKKKEFSAKKKEIESKAKKKSSEWLDLSLLSLFGGDIEKAMDELKKALG